MLFRSAQGFNFFDEEKIYIDPKTFLPLRVDRDLNIFGKKEKITEFYDARRGEVRIVKKAGKKVTEQVLRKKGFLDNIYCFIYRYRAFGKFQIGDKFIMNLPTTDIFIQLFKKQKVKALGRTLDAFYMQSNPKKYRIWFDSGSGKFPLRIDGAVGFGNTSMIAVAVEKD